MGPAFQAQQPPLHSEDTSGPASHLSKASKETHSTCPQADYSGTGTSMGWGLQPARPPFHLEACSPGMTKLWPLGCRVLQELHCVIIEWSGEHLHSCSQGLTAIGHGDGASLASLPMRNPKLNAAEAWEGLAPILCGPGGPYEQLTPGLSFPCCCSLNARVTRSRATIVISGCSGATIRWAKSPAVLNQPTSCPQDISLIRIC